MNSQPAAASACPDAVPVASWQRSAAPVDTSGIALSTASPIRSTAGHSVPAGVLVPADRPRNSPTATASTAASRATARAGLVAVLQGQPEQPVPQPGPAGE